MTLEEFYPELLKGLRISDALEKLSASPEAPPDTLEIKTAYDRILFEHVKKAAIGKTLANAYKATVANPVGLKALQATAVGVPAVAGGSYLLHRAGEESRKTVEDARNKALQTAGGIAAMGGGLMGLHRLLGTKPKSQTMVSLGNQGGQLVPLSVTMSKQSAVQATDEVLLEKLATVGYLDTVLEDQEKHASEDVRRDAMEMRSLNAEHGVHILKELLR